MDAKLNAIIESMHDEMIDTLQKWIRVPSVKGEAAPGAPFGKEVRSMLDMALADCEQMGFKTQNFDGYIAHADLGEGSDEDALAILAHLDVVPEGDGWKYPPYGAVIENGRMYGRGTSDDKGPAVAALYAMKAVKDAGIPLRRKVRLILGCDEECGSGDMKYYKEHTEMPRSGFSPDADYPVINIEKGGCHLRVVGRQGKEGLRIRAMQVGERANVVPGFASNETLLYSPELKFYSNRVKMDTDFNTSVKGLHCLGDSSGWTRGLMMASVMGVLMGRVIAREG